MEKKKKILLIILLIIFILLAIFVKAGFTQNIDNSIYQLIKKMRTENITQILKIITNLGGISSLFFISLTVAVILCIFKKRKIGTIIVLNLLISSSIYIILKNIIQRVRPDISQSLINEAGYSFPSGHTTNNTAFYALLIYLICKNVKNKNICIILSVILGIIPILIGFSRIYLGVHYFSDVIAGFCLGIICVIFVTSVAYNRITRD